MAMRGTLAWLLLRAVAVAASLLLAAAVVACTDPIPTAPAWTDAAAPEDRETRVRRVANILRDDARIVVDRSVVRFTGVLNSASVDRFFRRIEPVRGQIDTLIINSLGGITVSGRRIGDWVHENGITVIVHHMCFSSCANYIFTAAPRKIIRADALVGWHGSEQQARYITESRGITLEELIDEDVEAAIDRQELVESREINEGERARMRPQLRESFARLARDVDDEQEFLARIGVSVEALVYGLMPARYERYVTSGAYGWTFRIEDMAKFGIDNVTYEGTGEYPSAFTDPRRPVIVFDVRDP